MSAGQQAVLPSKLAFGMTTLEAAASEDKGCRQTMEDVHVIELEAGGTVAEAAGLRCGTVDAEAMRHAWPGRSVCLRTFLLYAAASLRRSSALAAPSHLD
eukprot:363433-Chlamydomonas_euryale.AAC.4